ncbi:MAG TPA: hypothetical protein VNT22_05760 [Baekduia sp.]|nr:hypothetical protein [Baekduia sp.]
MILVTIAVIVSTALGVLARHRYGDRATLATSRGINVLFWVILPVLTYFVIAHVRISAGVGFGVMLAFVAAAVVGTSAYLIGDRLLGLDRPSTGALINCVLIGNTGYLGIPLCATLLGRDSIGEAVTFDAVVGATTMFTAGFAVGAAFGTRAGETLAERGRAFFTRNPVLYAAAFGLIAPDAIAPIEATEVARTIFSLILPIGFFMLGVHLMGEREDGVLQFPPPLSKPIVAVIGLRLIVAPSILLAGTLLVGIPHAFLLQAAMPAGVYGVAIAHIYGLNIRLAAATIAWTTTIVVIAALAVSLVA